MFESIKKWIAEKLIKQYVPSLLRHGLTALAGFLAAYGVDLPEEQVGQLAATLANILVPLLIYLLGQIWSFKEKKDK